MSDKEVKNEKVMTKYDRKMQRRKEEKEKEAKQKKITTAVAVVAVIALVAFIASFPIRSYIAQNEAYVTINGEDVTKVEFDYNYNNVVNDYVGQYGAYLGYFGLDVSQDFSTQMYDENLSWKDYFEEMTVENMKGTKAIKAKADEAGFTFDASAEVADFREAVKEAAKTAEVSTKNYVKQLYGQYATVNNLVPFIEEAARSNAYYQQISEGMKATDDEIDAYYEENPDNYDSVDYYVAEFAAEITGEAPTEDEIADAMSVASGLAEEALDNIVTEGDKMVGETYADVAYAIADWLFDEARREGDSEVIEDADSNTCYAVEFVGRYLDETATKNVRMITLNGDNAQTVLDEWKAGAATEDSFAELCKKYTVDSSSISTGGLKEGLTEDSVSDELASWIFAEERVKGDATAITIESGYSYVLYYVGDGNPEWKVEIANQLLSEKQAEYMDTISADIVVEDKNGKLNYLKVQAQLEAEEGMSDGDGSDSDVSDSDVSDSDVSDSDVEETVSDSDVSAN